MSKKHQPEVYSVEQLKANAETVFGVQPEVIAGALYGNDKTEMSIDEMKSLIGEFLQKEVAE